MKGYETLEHTKLYQGMRLVDHAMICFSFVETRKGQKSFDKPSRIFPAATRWRDLENADKEEKVWAQANGVLLTAQGRNIVCPEVCVLSEISSSFDRRHPETNHWKWKSLRFVRGPELGEGVRNV